MNDKPLDALAVARAAAELFRVCPEAARLAILLGRMATAELAKIGEDDRDGQAGGKGRLAPSDVAILSFLHSIHPGRRTAEALQECLERTGTLYGASTIRLRCSGLCSAGSGLLVNDRDHRGYGLTERGIKVAGSLKAKDAADAASADAKGQSSPMGKRHAR